MNYVEFHIGDHCRRSNHLSMLEEGALLRLLHKYYTEEGPLPCDERSCCRLAGARDKSERLAVRTVLHEYFSLAADGWHQARADAEIARYRDKSERARASAQARWHPEGAKVVKTCGARAPGTMALPPEGGAVGVQRYVQLLQALGVQVGGSEALLQDWVRCELSAARLSAAVEQARQRRDAAGSTQPINLGLIGAILSDMPLAHSKTSARKISRHEQHSQTIARLTGYADGGTRWHASGERYVIDAAPQCLD